MRRHETFVADFLALEPRRYVYVCGLVRYKAGGVAVAAVPALRARRYC